MKQVKNPDILNQRNLYLFIHIPKTAGSSLVPVVGEFYLPWEKLHLSPDSFNKQKEKIVSLNKTTKEKICFVHGHMPFGYHSFFLDKRSSYITILRHPVERLISLYYYIKLSKNNYLYNTIEKYRMNLGEFVKSKITIETDNCQTRLINGNVNIEIGKISKEYMEEAQKNINNKFLFVGISEMFNESLYLFGKKMNVSQNFLYYVKKKVNKNRPLKEELSTREIDLIIETNQLDIELYTNNKRTLANALKEYYPEYLNAKFEKSKISLCYKIRKKTYMIFK